MQQIADLVDAFVRDYHAFHPHRAIWDGCHEHDGTAPDLGAAAIQQRVRALERWGERLRALAPAAVTTSAEAAESPAVPIAGPHREERSEAAIFDGLTSCLHPWVEPVVVANPNQSPGPPCRVR